MKASRIIMVIALAIVLVPSGMIGACYIRAKQYDHGLEQIALGQTKQSVIAAMGKPSEIEVCDGPVYYQRQLTGECSEAYIYYSFLEKWGVFIDKDGLVIGKYYNVSP